MMTQVRTLTQGDGVELLGHPHFLRELGEVSGGVSAGGEHEDQGRGRRGVLIHQTQICGLGKERNKMNNADQS